MSLLVINSLAVAAGTRTVFSDFSLALSPGDRCVIRGSNGAGKSSLAYAIMGNPAYKVSQGAIVFKGQDVLKLAPNARAKLGIFLAFQQPCAIPGVTVFNFLSNAYREKVEKKELYPSIDLGSVRARIEEVLKRVGLPKEYADRSVHENFSGGEKKRLEMAQLLFFRPELAILDEIDAGLDSAGVSLIVSCIHELQHENPDMIFMVITHSDRFVSALNPTSIKEVVSQNSCRASRVT